MVPMQKEIVSLRIFDRVNDVFPLVRYPIRPRQRTLLHGHTPAIRPNIIIGEEGGCYISCECIRSDVPIRVTI